MTARNLTRQSRSQSSKPHFTTETRSSQRSENFLIKNSLLRVLRVSAVIFHRIDTIGIATEKFAQAAKTFKQWQYGNIGILERIHPSFHHSILPPFHHSTIPPFQSLSRWSEAFKRNEAYEAFFSSLLGVRSKGG